MIELLNSLNSDFDDAEGWIRIVDADWFADDLKLNLSIHFHDGRESELWEVTCTGTIEESLSSNGTTMFRVSTDSPLLLPFIEPEVDIMFSENAVAPETLFGIVCSCCLEVMGRPERITKFMNGVPTTSGICSSKFGLLGRFPASLAARIVNALEDMPIRINALAGRPPKHWNGSQFEDYKPLHTLEVGNSYVVAERFSACRV